MATERSTVEFILDQLGNGSEYRAVKMFGEYALYLGNKVVALICDDNLYVKITDAGKKFVGKNYQTGTAYPGAKPSMLIDEKIEDGEWLQTLMQLTAESLPEPKPKRKKVVTGII
ncbi:MAG: TfoX/Sxy family protein [Candidatus Shapirobacteria bacterium]|jgi:TfoX/Sxy family transcriptional regulator of competence genes